MAEKDITFAPVVLTGADDLRFSDFGTCFSLDPAAGRIPVPLEYVGHVSAGKSTLTVITAPRQRGVTGLDRVECHPFSVQAFLPFGNRPMVTFVALAGAPPREPERFTAFVVPARHGIAYHPGTWHTGFMGLEADEAVTTFVRRIEDGSDTRFADLPFNLRLGELA